MTGRGPHANRLGRLSRAVPALAALTLALVLPLSIDTAPARAHPFWGRDLCGYDDSGRWAHHHTRRYDFLNGVGDPDWRRQTRDAQLDWHHRTPLRFDTTDHHAVAHIHAVDHNYGDTGWYGIAASPCYHEPAGTKHDHAKFNLFYRLSAFGKQYVACHEIGHLIGLAHSSTDDCMEGNTRYARVATVGDHNVRDVSAYYSHPPDGSPPH